jgi:hypothetical protein
MCSTKMGVDIDQKIPLFHTFSRSTLRSDAFGRCMAVDKVLQEARAHV